MTGTHDDLLNDLVLANRILAREGIVDGFGHVSVRHPEQFGRYFISRARAPELVTRADILELDLDSHPVSPTDDRLFVERFIHGSVYASRPDVMAVCHHHAPAVLPFCTTGVELVPVMHLGATMGGKVPLWDSQREFGDTSLLVANATQGNSMARALGSNWTLLLRSHGATVVGRSLREVVFRAIYGARNAEVQWQAAALGRVMPLTPGETVAAGNINLSAIAMDRSWERWCRRATRPD